MKTNDHKMVRIGLTSLALLAGLFLAQPSGQSYFHGIERFKGANVINDPKVNDLITWSKDIIVEKDVQTDFAGYVVKKAKAGEINVQGPENYNAVMTQYLLFKINELKIRLDAVDNDKE